MRNATCEPRGDRSFHWLNATQFLGALNDNLFKLLLIFFLIGLQGPAAAGRVAAVGGALFVAPFLLFSPLAGRIADRLSKRSIIVVAKFAELAIMAAGALAFWLQSPWGLYAALLLMSAQSTLFSPAKYGIVPELVGRERLSRANGQLEAATWLAVIAGTTCAALLPALTGDSYAGAALFCVLVAAAGVATAWHIAPTPTAKSEGALLSVGELRHTLGLIRRDGYLLLAVLGSAWFMFAGAFFQLNLIPFGIGTLGLTEQQSGALFLAAALGIGAGSLLAGRLSGHNIEFGVVPVGALVLTLAAAFLGSAPGLFGALLAIVVAGVGAGLLIVPIQSFIQWRAPAERRGEVLAAANLLGWVGVLAASALIYLFAEVLHLAPHQGFFVLGLLTLGLTLTAFRVLPDFFLRFLNLLVMRLVYRVRVRGEALPSEGGALLVANHVSWIDALLLLATTQRRIRFLMEREIFQQPLLRPIFRLMGVIPVSSKDAPRQVAASLREARRALDDGYLVCIFAEGQISRNGQLGRFKSGLERIVAGSAHPIIPIYLGGVWGSRFSYGHDRRRRLPGAVSIHFGAPLPAAAGADAVRRAVQELSCSWFAESAAEQASLAAALVRSARRHWRQPALADTGGKRLSYGATLQGALALGAALEGICAGQAMVGLLLPPSVGGALANLALTLRGKVPVNLNYTAAPAARGSAIAQCGIRTVVTSRALLEKLGEEPPVGAVYLEDLVAELTPWQKLRAAGGARLLPAGRLVGRGGAEELATVIFSSGSTGDPKGVMLSHRNLLANIEALQILLAPQPQENLCAALPFFHSLGFTGTLWLPLLSGFSVVYHPNPLDGAAIAEAVREHRSTLLLATPTFLLTYLRRARPADFASLRLVLTGAEKLQPRVADAFEERFGVRPLEGYGATELAPVTAINLPTVERGGLRQEGGKEGSVGRPLPGVAVRIVDPASGAELPAESAGLILVRGANVMQGYLNRPRQSAEVLKDGWYVTGDIGRLDADGFLHITDRLARFSKIGGEMVPHLAVEEALRRDLRTLEPALAVTALPDARKGERLVVLFTAAAGGIERLRRALDESGLPNLWRPARDAFVEVAEIPQLGSGKLDLGRLRELAGAALGAATA